MSNRALVYGLRQDQDPATFRNLKYDWTHYGGFAIHFADDNMFDLSAPASASVNGIGFEIKGGSVRSPHGKKQIEMTDETGLELTWPVESALLIRNLYGQLLWVNPRYHHLAEGGAL